MASQIFTSAMTSAGSDQQTFDLRCDMQSTSLRYMVWIARDCVHTAGCHELLISYQTGSRSHVMHVQNFVKGWQEERTRSTPLFDHVDIDEDGFSTCVNAALTPELLCGPVECLDTTTGLLPALRGNGHLSAP